MMETLAKGLAEAGNTTTSNMNMEKLYGDAICCTMIIFNFFEICTSPFN